MSKIYKCSEIEEQAKKLLAPIQVACPDNLWQQLNYSLDEHYTSNEKTWKNSLSTPKTLGLAIGCISLIILAAWKLLPMINNASASQAPVAIAKPQKPSVVKTDPPPVSKPAAVAVTNTDSIAKANAAKDSIQKQAEITQASTNASIRAYWAKRDSIRKRYLLSLNAHKDSSSHTSNVPDTVAKVHHRHVLSYDSVASVTKDSIK